MRHERVMRRSLSTSRSSAWILPTVGLLVSATLGCNGLIGDPGVSGDETTDPVDDPTRPSVPQPVEYVPGVDPIELPAERIWRLTPQQYVRAFRAAFGMSSVTAADFETDPRRDGFDNIASQNHVDAAWAVVVHRNAQLSAAAIEPTLQESRACLYDSAPDDACLAAFVDAYATPAYRRPLTPEERADLTALYRELRSAGNPAGESVTGVLEAIAQSPNFLYRLEVGTPVGDGSSALDAYALASQLSFMLTDSPPSEALLADAETGRLLDPVVVAEHATELLDTPEALAKVTEFFEQYLGTYTLRDGLLPKDDAMFPAFSLAVQDAMRAETERFVANVVFTPEGTLNDVFAGNVTFVDDSLREFYGWSGSAAPDAPFEIPNGERSGLFMHGSVLAARSNSVDSDALHRGLFIYEDLLCEHIEPPAGLDINSLGNLLDSPDPEDTERQRFEFLQENNPECAGCHALFLPYGFGLETFDPVGVFRAEQNGRPLDTTGELRGTDNDGPFANGPELFARIGESAKGQACFAEHWLRYALGDHFAVPLSAALVAQLRDRELRMRDLLLLVAQEPAFYLRRPEEERE
jgi:hypothetical protein